MAGRLHLRRWAVVGAAITAVIALGAVVVVKSDLLDRGGNPRIAVVTDETLVRTFETRSAAERFANAVSPENIERAFALRRGPRDAEGRAADHAQGGDKTAASDPAPAPDTSAPATTTENVTAAAATTAASSGEIDFRADDALVVTQTLIGELQNQLNSRLSDSGRFDVVATDRVRTALLRAYRRGELSELRPADAMRSQAQAITADADKQKQQKLQQISSSQSRADLARLGKSLDADYILYVGVQEPSFIWSWEDDEIDPRKVIWVFRAQPTFVYSLFDAQGIIVKTGVIRFEDPIETRSSDSYSDPAEYFRRTVSDTRRSQSGQQTQKQSGSGRSPLEGIPAMQEMSNIMNDMIGQRVLAGLLNTLAPAEVLQTEPAFVINRGANDGLTQGMVLTAYRMSSEELREGSDQRGRGGRAIGQDRTRIGTVRVDDVQERVARVVPLAIEAGRALAVRDVIILPEASSDPVVGPNPVAPTACAQWDRSCTQQANVPAVAIDSIHFHNARGETINLDKGYFERVLTAAFNADSRVRVLDRSQRAALLRERAIDQRSTSRRSDVQRSMDQSAYLITANITIEETSSQQSMDVDGRRVATGPVVTTIGATGDFSLTRLGGSAAISGSGINVTSSGASSDRGAMEAAMRALAEKSAGIIVSRMYPPRVIAASNGLARLSGGENAGLKVGDQVRAYRVGEELKDDDGNVIGRVRDYAGDLEIVDVQPMSSAARPLGQWAPESGARYEIEPAPPAPPQRRSTSAGRAASQAPAAGPTPF